MEKETKLIGLEKEELLKIKAGRMGEPVEGAEIEVVWCSRYDPNKCKTRCTNLTPQCAN